MTNEQFIELKRFTDANPRYRVEHFHSEDGRHTVVLIALDVAGCPNGSFVLPVKYAIAD